MSERPIHAPPWSLERTTGYLKRAGVDLDTGERVKAPLCECGHSASDHQFAGKLCEGINERFDAPPVSCSCEGYREVAR